MQTVKKGSRGEDVKTCQRLLNKALGLKLAEDGVAGVATDNAIRAFQQLKRLIPVDGICGPKTWEELLKYNTVIIESSDLYTDYFLKPGQYVAGNYPKDLLVLHHTAGWHDPTNVIQGWGANATRVATEYVVGGLKCTNGDAQYDGKIYHAFPTGGYAYHIGSSGQSGMDKRSIGIEVCDFGHLTIDATGQYRTYTNAICQPEQVCTLKEPFRGYKYYHRYSDKELESLKKLMLFIADRNNIDLRNGLYTWIKNQGTKAFDFQADAFYGKVKNGVVTHANIRKDKEDMFPQPELIDMILSL